MVVCGDLDLMLILVGCVEVWFMVMLCVCVFG